MQPAPDRRPTPARRRRRRGRPRAAAARRTPPAHHLDARRPGKQSHQPPQPEWIAADDGHRQGARLPLDWRVSAIPVHGGPLGRARHSCLLSGLPRARARPYPGVLRPAPTLNRPDPPSKTRPAAVWAAKRPQAAQTGAARALASSRHRCARSRRTAGSGERDDGFDRGAWRAARRDIGPLRRPGRVAHRGQRGQGPARRPIRQPGERAHPRQLGRRCLSADTRSPAPSATSTPGRWTNVPGYPDAAGVPRLTDSCGPYRGRVTSGATKAEASDPGSAAEPEPATDAPRRAPRRWLRWALDGRRPGGAVSVASVVFTLLGRDESHEEAAATRTAVEPPPRSGRPPEYALHG